MARSKPVQKEHISVVAFPDLTVTVITRVLRRNKKGQWWVRFKGHKLPVMLNMYAEPPEYFAILEPPSELPRPTPIPPFPCTCDTPP